jgi:hypothetical protein
VIYVSWQYLDSSNLRAARYDAAAQTLDIEFHSGSVYRYYGVPASVYQGLLAASSHGSYHHAHIKNSYRYQRIG